MKGDFSRWTAPNARAQGYAGVLMQQGRLHTDADWNEQAELTARRAETALGDVIGRSGAPKEGGGFRISPAAPPGGFAISAGRFHLDGVLIENPQATTYADQAAPVTPEALNEILENGQEGLVYLEAWKEHVTALDDGRLAEPALGGPDTATRVAIRWRVGVMPSPFADAAAREAAIRDARRGIAPDIPAWRPGTGALIAGTAPPEELEDDADCLIPPEAGYLSQENQLYRIEIVRGGSRGQARFVWSRENGSVVAGLARDETGAFVLIGAREDEALGFVSGGWVEVSDAADRFRGQAGRLTRMTLQDGVATFSPGIGAFEDMVEPKVRRWDHPVASPATGLPLRATPTDLERGIQVSFADGRYRVGDYWVVPARAATGAIDWPPWPAEADAPIPPFGWGRRFAPLALATRSGEGVRNIVDLRPLFPPLTGLQAEDVHFDDASCELGAETVQQAIDALCHRGRGKCTIFAHDAAALRAGVEALRPGQHAHICLGEGMFQLQATLRLSGLGHVTVSGAGPQSLLTVGGDEAALEIGNCASVRLEDFAVNGGRVGSSGRSRGRLGAITVRDCGDVAVERVNARCRAGPWRHASCVAVYATNRSGPVRVRDCRLTVGQGQTGVQIIGAERALVENNRIRAARAPRDLVTRRLRADGALVAAIARGMIRLPAAPGASGEAEAEAPARPGAENAPPAAGRPRETAGRRLFRPVRRDAAREVRARAPAMGEVTLAAHPSVESAVTEYVARADLSGIRSSAEFKARMVNVAREAVRADGAVSVGGRVINGFRDYVRRIPTESFFFEGVVIAGPRVESAEVLGNDIDGAQNGVRVAASSQVDRVPPNWRSAEPENVVARAVIERNRVRLLPPAPGLPAHGVYLGHARVAEVSANDVRGPGRDASDTLWYGVRSYGWRGHMLAISRNAAAHLGVGVSVMPDLDTDSGQWFVTANGALDVEEALELARGVRVWP
ncbi:MAG: DUF6519 domain-containing protein [Pseudomonadota bacterium]